jgi:hypothetical protein
MIWELTIPWRIASMACECLQERNSASLHGQPLHVFRIMVQYGHGNDLIITSLMLQLQPEQMFDSNPKLFLFLKMVVLSVSASEPRPFVRRSQFWLPVRKEWLQKQANRMHFQAIEIVEEAAAAETPEQP